MVRSLCLIPKFAVLSLTLVVGAGVLSGCGDSEDSKTGAILKEDAAKQAEKSSMEERIKAAYAKGVPNKTEKPKAAAPAKK
jgi:hypothetical protein